MIGAVMVIDGDPLELLKYEKKQKAIRIVLHAKLGTQYLENEQ